MKGLLNGELIEYSELTYEQFCNPALVILREALEDAEILRDSNKAPKLNPETQRQIDGGETVHDWAAEWSEYYSKPFLWRLFHKPPKNIL
jgi:hypothetical protein